MWILISFLTLCVHTISICPPPSTPPEKCTIITKLSLTNLKQDPDDNDRVELTSPRAHSTAPHQTIATTPSTRPTNTNPMEEAAKIKCLYSCSSTDSSDDEKELPFIPAQEQPVSPRLTNLDHTPPTRRSDIPRPSRNITPPPTSTQALIPTTLPLDDFTPAQQSDIPQRVNVRRPTPPLPRQSADKAINTLTLPPSKVSLAELMLEQPTALQRIDIRRPSKQPDTKAIMQSAFAWVLQQLKQQPSTKFIPCPDAPTLSYKLTETPIIKSAILQRILSIKPQPTSTPNKEVRVQELWSSDTVNSISVCMSFIDPMAPEDLQGTPLAQLLAYLQQHLSSNQRLKIPADTPRVFDCCREDSAIHCVMKYLTPKQ